MPVCYVDEATYAALQNAAAGKGTGVLWSSATETLNVNVVAWNAGGGVALHVNPAVEVALIVLSGVGKLTVDDRAHDLNPGDVVVIPRGAERAIRATERLVYVTVHGPRPGLMPAVPPGSSSRR